MYEMVTQEWIFFLNMDNIQQLHDTKWFPVGTLTNNRATFYISKTRLREGETNEFIKMNFSQ